MDSRRTNLRLSSGILMLVNFLFTGKPLPGGPPGGAGGASGHQQQGAPPGPGQYPPQMRGAYPPNSAAMSGQSISQPSGPTPTLNELLRGGATAPGGAAPPGMSHGHRYPPPGGYEHGSYNGPSHGKSEYPPGSSWQGGPPPPPSNSRPPVNSYGHPPPPNYPPQAVYRQVRRFMFVNMVH